MSMRQSLSAQEPRIAALAQRATAAAPRTPAESCDAVLTASEVGKIVGGKMADRAVSSKIARRLTATSTVDDVLGVWGVDSDGLELHSVSTWRVLYASGIDIRTAPHNFQLRTGDGLEQGDVFRVSSIEAGEHGVRFLQLADGRGWLFDSVPGLGSVCERLDDTGT